MDDKLPAIEDRFEQNLQTADDVRWLITEVKRLRLADSEQRRLANMRTRSYWTSPRPRP